MNRLLPLALAILILLLSARAVTQAGITLAPASITVDEPLQPGHTYRLPQMSITNGGESALHLELSYTTTAPGAVIHFLPQRFIALPGNSRQVSLLLQLPLTLPTGNYKALIQAQSKTEYDIVLQLAAPLSFTAGRRERITFGRNLNWLALPVFFFLALAFIRAMMCRFRR